jgi:hypothetical protein
MENTLKTLQEVVKHRLKSNQRPPKYETDMLTYKILTIATKITKVLMVMIIL